MANGGARPGAGRKRGVPNKATGEIKLLAQRYGSEAIEMLVKIMREGESEIARRGAANDLIDRGYGKPAQAIEHSGKIGVATELSDAELSAIAAAGHAATSRK